MNNSLTFPRANHGNRAQRALATGLACLLLLTQALPVWAAWPVQDPVTGAFEGTVTNSRTGAIVAGAVVQFINTATEVPVAKRADAQGRFYQGLLQPGFYRIRVSAPGYQTRLVEQRLLATRGNTVVPLPVTLDPVVTTVATTTTPAPTQPVTPTPAPANAPTPAPVVSSDVAAELNTTDGRRNGAFTEEEVTSLPLGGTTWTRTFDHFALIVPGVALPPQTLGRVAGPGVGSGVGSAGQFAVNGLRSRANNFLVDGSDNNDEDIGVRRQGFFTLVPQPPESIREYQVITALAPAQFGRNIGAQVNAISKSGGFQTHGSFYGFLNTTALNGRDFFDTEAPRTEVALQGRTLNLNNFSLGGLRDVFVTRINGGTNLGRSQVRVSNPAYKQDSQTFAQSGFVLGGPLLARPQAAATGAATPDGANKSAFYFMSFEGQILNANRETNFAVPTVEQRGFFNSGATGLYDLFGTETFPTSLQGDAVFSLYPFANNPNGVYGRNTYTQLLPASAQGYVASFKMDHNRRLWGREQSFTGRYNRTNDWRNIPATGGALFATLRPVVGTQNFSFFWNSEVSGEAALTPVFNQFRASYGRTRLNFEEEADREHLIPSSIYPNLPFLLNAPLLLNATQPGNTATEYILRTDRNTEKGLLFNGGFGNLGGGGIGPVGQILVPGFSPLGVDVNNFPQSRVNNTFQVADILSLRSGTHSAAFGVDIRRVQLNSDLPRNARTQLVFGGAPALFFDITNDGRLVNFRVNDFVAPSSLVAAGAASSSFTTLATTTSNIGLRYTQYNAFAQDEWRVRPNLSFTYGLRYEYNSPPREVDSLIENSFSNAALSLPGVAGLRQFINGREGIFDPDRNNFAPRLGFAYSPTIGGNRSLVLRGGYGLYYDQILGAVVSQSRNVFPNFLTINTGGGLRGNTIGGANLFAFNIFNAGQSLSGNDFSNGINLADGRFVPYVVPGTLNQFNPNLPTSTLVNVLNRETGSGFGITLPSRELPMPLAHQFSLSAETQLTNNLVASVSYVGTRGSKLLRLTTPNLGPNLIALASPFLLLAEEDEDLPSFGSPTLFGAIIGPGQRLSSLGAPTGGRPVANAGTIYRYETSAESRYDSLQLQLRGRFRTAVNWQLGYTWSNARDDASDVFDLGGAFALPQNSLSKLGEYGPSNYDTRHRLAYNVNWMLPTLVGASKAKQLLLGGFEIASLGQFQSGQPYTVNSILDINLDGNYTDRLNTTNGLQFVEEGRERIRLNTNFGSLWAPLGQDGALARNTFRGNNYLLLDLAIVKNFNFTERQRLTFRAEAFNFLNHANFALPVRFLEAPSFGQAVDTITPGRRIQFALKYSF
jgi:hypothetical protein